VGNLLRKVYKIHQNSNKSYKENQFGKDIKKWGSFLCLFLHLQKKTKEREKREKKEKKWRLLNLL